MMSGEGFCACRRNSGFVIRGGGSFAGAAGGGDSWGIDDTGGGWGVGGVDCETSSCSALLSSKTAASEVCWISRSSSISAAVRPLDSRNSFFRSIAALRMESSSRNLEALSIRDTLVSGDWCWAGSCGGMWAGCSGT